MRVSRHTLSGKDGVFIGFKMNYSDYLGEIIQMKSLEFRETCRHGVDYDIYDSLNNELKIKYAKQFHHQIVVVKDGELSLRCKANHLDKISDCWCDCSENYPKTIEYLSSPMI